MTDEEPEARSPNEGPPEDARGAFELEEPADDLPTRPPSLPPPDPDPGASSRPEEAPHAGADVGADADDEGVDPRTLAERMGKSRVHGVEALPPPAGWPGEAFRFPLLDPGRVILLAGAGIFILLDMGMMLIPDVAYLFLLLKLLALLGVVLRGQFGIASKTASGADHPIGWGEGMALDEQEFKRHAFFVVLLLAMSLPGIIVWWLLSHMGIALALLLPASMYATVMAVGITVGDPRVRHPLRALSWLVKHPLACMAGSVAWWCFALSERVLAGLTDDGAAVAVFASTLLRLASFYMLLLSARVIGVLSRRWTP